MPAIWWIRRDLRLMDNSALRAALGAGSVIPLFILDQAFSRTSSRRKDFLHEGLYTLDRDLRARKSYLVLRAGKPVEVLRQLLHETRAEAVYAEQDFTPYAVRREEDVAPHVPLQLISGQTVHHPAYILKRDGKPYTVFTPYAKAWKARLPSAWDPYPAPDRIDTPAHIKSLPLPGFKVSPLFPAGEQEALVRLEEFLHQRIHAY